MNSALTVPFTLIGSFWAILRSPKLLALSTIPAIIGVVSFLAIFISSLVNHQAIASLVVSTQSWWGDALSFVGVTLVAFIGGTIGAFILTNLLAVFTLDEIAKEVLIREGVKTVDTPFSVMMVLTILLESIIRCFYLLILGVITLLCSFFPPLTLVPLLIGALIIGADLLDTPLSQRGYTLHQKIAFIKSAPLQTLVLGGCFSFVLLIPFVGSLFLPLGVVSAAKIIASTKEAIPPHTPAPS